MTISRFEVRENNPTHEGLRSWYINMLSVDESGMTPRETILDGFLDEHDAQSLCNRLNQSSIHIGKLLNETRSDHRTDIVITLTFRW
jgi:hypothetical protein